MKLRRYAWWVFVLAGCSVPEFTARRASAVDASDVGVEAGEAGTDASDAGPDAVSAPDVVADAVTTDVTTDVNVDAVMTDVMPDADVVAPVDVAPDIVDALTTDVSPDADASTPVDVAPDVVADAPSDRATDVEGCAGGGTRCNGACVATDSDPMNCGACGLVCPVGAGSVDVRQVCVGGVCVAAQRSCRPTGDGGVPEGCGLVRVEGGTFTMGARTECPAPDGGTTTCAYNSSPEQPNVTVDRFTLDAYEVTVGRFRAFWAARMADGGASIRARSIRYPDRDGTVRQEVAWGTNTGREPTPRDALFNWSSSPSSPSREAHPINGVDWWTAQEFCVWDRGPATYGTLANGRLPTEAEWEYAARGRVVGALTAGRTYPWGDTAPSASCDRARWNSAACSGDDGASTRRVGSFPAGASGGLFDLAGNVYEWTADDFIPYGVPTCVSRSGRQNPRCTATGSTSAVVRGGSWFVEDAALLRSASRADLAPTARSFHIGFRCAATATSTVVPTPTLSLGDQHTCALRPDGTVRCWGFNNVGQLGTCSLTASTSAVPVMTLRDAVGISVGGGHTCALRATGQLSCWGFNESGQLGDGTVVNQMCPVGVADLTDVVQVAAGGNHTCALRTSGAVSCWGAGTVGELGNGMMMTSSFPVSVTGSVDAVSIVAGSSHTCALRASGQVVCWGANSLGQLGDGSRTNRSSPVLVSGLTDAVQISAGGVHTCARRRSGRVVCWGRNNVGQLGDNTTTDQTAPTTEVLGLVDAVEVAAGSLHTCARRASGAVMCWGNNEQGQTGNGTSVSPQLRPVEVLGLSDATEVATNKATHTCARSAAQGVVCWGYNGVGQLGDGSLINRFRPVAVTGL